MAGDRIALMEAMKMQTPILSEIEGIITAIYARQGEILQPGQKIFNIDIDQ